MVEKELPAYILIPAFEGDEVGQKDDVVLENTVEIGIPVGFEVYDTRWVGFGSYHLPAFQSVMA